MADSGWALDLGTTNTGIARWDAASGRPELVELPDVCRKPEGAEALEAPRLVPSAVHLIHGQDVWTRLGRWPPLVRRAFLGRWAWIGREALERNYAIPHAAYVPTFKPSLTRGSVRPLARLGRRDVTPREAARAFLRELLFAVKRATGERPRDLTVTCPVSAFEGYRAELRRILEGLGVRRVRFLDEPVAAAVGYGLSLSRDRTVLVVDIGGGTMHMVVVRLSPRGAMGGQAQVLAKQACALGGNAVDGWVLLDVCRQAGFPMLERADDEELRLWRRLMLAEACRVKEAVFFDEDADFLVTPPGQAWLAETRQPGAGAVHFTRARLVELLEANGLYRGLGDGLTDVLQSASLEQAQIDEVLLVGGSTLLPGVFGFFEQRFERRRLRAWHPFEAVAHGAACFAAGQVDTLDFIVHDYAFLTHDARTGAEQHTVIVPRGTRFPTPPHFWRRQVVPTCALGEPESLFKLVICEIAQDHGQRRFVWDAAGDLHKVGGESGDARVVVPLNASNPTLGYLDPPHAPGDRRPRLEVAFGVNADRWLVATVQDLLTRDELMREEPVVRLV